MSVRSSNGLADGLAAVFDGLGFSGSEANQRLAAADGFQPSINGENGGGTDHAACCSKDRSIKGRDA
jgi:hypothetical protein